jgi:ATP-binding cassette subfamily B protein
MTPQPGRVLRHDEAVLREVLPFAPQSMQLAVDDAQAISTALSLFAQLHGLQLDAESARISLASAGGASPLRMATTLEPLGLHTRLASLSAGSLARQPLPALIFTGPRPWVALKVTGSRLVALDPCRGVVEVALAEMEPSLGPHALLAEQARFNQLEGPTSVRGVMRLLIAEHRVLLANLVLLSLGGFGLSLLGPRFGQTILDEVLTLRDPTTLVTCFTGLALTTAFSVLIASVRGLLTTAVAVRLSNALATHLQQHVLSLPASFFHKHRSGQVVTRLLELEEVRHFIANTTVQAASDTFGIGLFILVLWIYGWKIALLPLVGLLLLLAVRFAFRARRKRGQRAGLDAASASTSLISEQVASITTLKATGAERSAQERWESTLLKVLEAEREANFVGTTLQGVAGFVTRLVSFGGLWAAGVLALGGELTPGEVLAVSMYLEQAIAPMFGLSTLLTSWERLGATIGRLDEVALTPPERPAARAQTNFTTRLEGKIRFENVSFRYTDEGPWVLRELSFTIYPHQVVAIVGASGSGKSTLAQLLTGALAPTQGRICFDDNDLAGLSLSTVRSQVGFIAQARELFAGSVADNVAFADDAPDDAKLNEAIERAAATDFVGALPRGLKYHLGEGRLGLSGGQAQRLCIAHTLYRLPTILLLDEATSALDFESEQKVLETLREQRGAATTIIISHRVSSIRRADQVLVLNGGRLAEEGTHPQLIEAGGLYAELFGKRGESQEF